MNRILLQTGGSVNAFFELFHVWLGYQIHSSLWPRYTCFSFTGVRN
jgi:hypothetical protein